VRLGIRGREILVVTVLTFMVVTATTIMHLARLSRVVVEEAGRQAELTARQVYAQASRALARAPDIAPHEALRRDPDLRGLLEAAVGYSPHLLYASVADTSGRVILHTQSAREGTLATNQTMLTALLDLDAPRRFAVLFGAATTHEYVLPLRLGEAPFGSIRLGVSSTLLRREMGGALRESLLLAGFALLLALVLAVAMARVVLQPIRALAGHVDRLRRGEFDARAPALAGGDEFQELSAQLGRLGQELQADRLAGLGDQVPLQQVVDQFEDAVILLNSQRHVLFFNRAAGEVVGRSLEAAVGEPLEALLGPGHPLSSLVSQMSAQGAGSRNLTLTLPGRDHEREVLASVFPVAEPPAGAVGLVVILKDLESVKTVQSLVSYSAKLTALGRLTSGVAHEVKNPLNAMMIHLELLRERLGDSAGDVRQSLEVIGSEIRRLDRVVQGFLRFMRPQELALKRLDLNALLTSLVALLEAEWGSHGVRFVLETSPELPELSADEELLRQAFLNVLQNAGQAMPKGGTVTLRTEQAFRAVRVTIIDDGVGIPPADLDKVCRLYFTTKPGGTGIGLALVYRIVQLHDGTLEIRSDEGRGTTVTVTLPIR
jgi:signal transduction histidine kinase/HAMP domain-containing protein